ncbi:MAG: hypothetical protein FIA97_15890 [Methylococcaceae bacterium]|nr:hypothetical protein [Methylococcaceae bacterium]
MNHLPLTRLSAAIALLAGSQAAHALVPWTDAVPAANVIYISGGAAQDAAFSNVIENVLAEPGTLDTFGDAKAIDSSDWGARWTAYYFKAKSSFTQGLGGQNVVVVKRSLGAAGYGVVPVIAGSELEELDISRLTGADGTTVKEEGAAGSHKYRVVVTSANAADTLTNVVSDAGILGVDAKLLLKPGSINYPAAVARVNATGSDVFPSNIATVPNTFTQLSTGGQVHGIAVTSDFYKVLQAAQVISGTLPADTVIGDYEHERNIPTLGRNFVGSILSGKVETWDQVQVVAAATAHGATAGTAYKLTDPVVTALAGVDVPTKVGAEVPVAVSNRNAGAAIGAVAYASFLNYPWTEGAFAPATATSQALEGTAKPLVKQPGGVGATGNLLDDWNQGTNVSTLNNVNGAKRWGIGVQSADANNSGTAGTAPEDAGKKHYRFVRIDGYLPSIENVASGNYADWAEGVLLYNNATTGTKANVVEILTAIANGLSSPSTAGTVNQKLVTTWGNPGIFGLTSGGHTQSIPYADATPVVAYSHKKGSAYLGEIVPTISGAAGGVLLK